MHPQSPLPPDILPAHKGLSRRSLVAAAAWSTPAIVASAGTPAFAASPPPSGINAVVFDRSSFTIAGGESVTLSGTVTANSATPLPINIVFFATLAGDFPRIFNADVTPTGPKQGRFTVDVIYDVPGEYTVRSFYQGFPDAYATITVTAVAPVDRTLIRWDYPESGPLTVIPSRGYRGSGIRGPHAWSYGYRSDENLPYAALATALSPAARDLTLSATLTRQSGGPEPVIATLSKHSGASVATLADVPYVGAPRDLSGDPGSAPRGAIADMASLSVVREWKVAVIRNDDGKTSSISFNMPTMSEIGNGSHILSLTVNGYPQLLADVFVAVGTA